MSANNEYKICSRGVWDSSVPGISFNGDGVSNYAKMFDELCVNYPRGEKGRAHWDSIVRMIKDKGKGKKYDCIIGVSGGTDSSYLLHLAKVEYGLRPLAVTLDNGWNSEIAVKNIKKVTKALEIDLYTLVIDYEEVKKVLRAYLKSGLPWVDGPTDLAINSALLKTAQKENVKFILNGSDFRSEGKQPIEWTYTDAKQLIHIVKLKENANINTYPSISLFEQIYLTFFAGFKMYRPYYFLDYQKKSAQLLLTKLYNWEYYGGHHHENVFTRFIIGHWLPEKFGIDKRIITLSAQILSVEITRQEALAMLKLPPYSRELIQQDETYIIKKLELSKTEYEIALNGENKNYLDYPSYFKFIGKHIKFITFLSKQFLPFIPTTFLERKYR